MIVNDFEIQTDKVVMASQPDQTLWWSTSNRKRKKVVVIKVAIASNTNIKKKEHKKFEKRLKEELRKMWKVYCQ